MTDKQTVKFGDICCEVKLTTKDPIADGYERYIGLEHLDSGSLKIKRWGMIAEDNPSFTRVFKKGHILFGKRRPYLKKAAIAEFDGICSGDIIVMDAKSENSISTLLPFIVHSEGFWDWAIKTSSGSLSPRTKFKELAKYEIKLGGKHSTSETMKILQCINRVTQALDITSESAVNIFGAIITNIMTFGLKRTEIPAQTRYLKHNPSWSVKPLAEIIKKVKRGPSLSTNENGIGVRYLTSGNIQNNRVDMNAEVKHLENHDSIDQYLILERDILFNCVNSMAQVGKVAHVGKDTFSSEVIVGFNNYALEVNEDVVDSKFLYYFMSDKRFLHRVRALVKPAINQASFASKELNHMLISFPSIIEQRRIVALLDQFSTLFDNCNNHVRYCSKIQTSLSQNLGI
ncbi:restriction endonuclease subunit S [Enterobacter mori]